MTIVALALMVHHTLKACEVLSQEGISVELIDPRTVAPLDITTIQASVKKTGRLLIVDETFATFGLVPRSRHRWSTRVSTILTHRSGG